MNHQAVTFLPMTRTSIKKWGSSSVLSCTVLLSAAREHSSPAVLLRRVRPPVLPAASAASLLLLLPAVPVPDFFLSMLCRAVCG